MAKGKIILFFWLVCMLGIGVNAKMSYGLNVGNSNQEGVIITPPTAPINYSTIATVNDSTYWGGRESEADLDHSLLDNLE